jgi:excisionase family DNA binding protein
MNDEFLTVKEAAAYMKRTPGNIYNLVCAGDLKHFKPNGKLLLFKRADLQAWIERGAVSSNDEIAAQAASRS